MGGSWTIGRERTIEYGKIGISAKPDECVAILRVTGVHDRLTTIFDPIADRREIGNVDYGFGNDTGVPDHEGFAGYLFESDSERRRRKAGEAAHDRL